MIDMTSTKVFIEQRFMNLCQIDVAQYDSSPWLALMAISSHGRWIYTSDLVKASLFSPHGGINDTRIPCDNIVGYFCLPYD